VVVLSLLSLVSLVNGTEKKRSWVLLKFEEGNCGGENEGCDKNTEILLSQMLPRYCKIGKSRFLVFGEQSFE